MALPESDKAISALTISELVENRIGRKVNFSISIFRKSKLVGKSKTLGSYWGARKFLNQQTFDFCMVRVPILLVLSVNQGLPTIFEAHNTLLHNRYQVLHNFWKYKLVTLSKKKEMLLFVTISKALADHWIQEGVPGQKVVPLHDGFDSLMYREKIPMDEARKLLGIGQSLKIVTYTGSLYEDRGIETILNLARCYKDVQFWILGGPLKRKQYFEALARERQIDNVVFQGWVKREKVKEFLFASDVLLMIWTRSVKTINFCSPLKMFEYMASGRVIVGHGFPTIKEVLKDGREALLVDPDSFDDLKKKIGMALSLKCAPEMARQARQLAFKEYSWDKRVDTILRLLQFRN